MEKIKPNVLLIIADNLKANCVGYNNDEVITPNIDRLKSESVNFHNGYSFSPTRLSSRYGIYSGRYPSFYSKGVSNCSNAETSFVELLSKENVYDSSYIGDEYWEENNLGFNNCCYKNPNINDEDLNFLIGKDKNSEPWFLTLSYSLKDIEEFENNNIYDNREITLPLSFVKELNKKPSVYINRDADESEIRDLIKSYYMKITILDKRIGLIMELLKKNGIYDDTYILFTSNHGDFMGEFGMMNTASLLAETLVRVPLLLKPSIKDYIGHTEEHVGYNADVASTILSIAELTTPSFMASNNLLKFIEENDTYKSLKDCLKTPVFLESDNMRAIIRDGWKLIYTKGNICGELYDLTDDPYELDNVYDKESFAQIRTGLMNILCDKMIEIGCN